jgi:hypothetical protein
LEIITTIQFISPALNKTNREIRRRIAGLRLGNESSLISLDTIRKEKEMIPARKILIVVTLAFSQCLTAQTNRLSAAVGATEAIYSSSEPNQATVTTANLLMPRKFLVAQVLRGLNAKSHTTPFSVNFMPSKHAINAMLMSSSGTQNFVAKFVDSSNDLGNSDLFDSNGAFGIGTTNPQAILDLETNRDVNLPIILIQANFAMELGTFNDGGQGGPAGSSLGSTAGFNSSFSGLFLNSNGTAVNGSGGAQINTSLPSWRMALGSGTSEWAGGDNFAVGRVAAGGNYGSPASLFSVSNTGDITVAGGVNHNGAGIKHLRTPGCTGTGCVFTVTWPGTAFADTNYTVVCTPEPVAVGVSVSNKTTTSISVAAATVTPNNVITLTEIDCIAMHD